MTRAVVVDDEPLARERLRTLLAAEPDITVVAESRDGLSALQAVQANRPDLLLLDIQMPEMDGFEVLQALPEPLPAIIFVTAYDQYALRAFDVAAVDYVLKPIDEDRFRVALARARERFASHVGADDGIKALLRELRERRRWRTRFAVRNGDSVAFVQTGDVEWLQAERNYVRLFARGRTHIVRETMKALESELDPERFLRVHRSVIVRVDCIAGMQPHFHGEWVLLMRDGTRFTSSRTYGEQVRRLLR